MLNFDRFYNKVCYIVNRLGADKLPLLSVNLFTESMSGILLLYALSFAKRNLSIIN